MADQPKKKSPNARVTNENRGNRKASKTGPDTTFGRNKEYRGSHTRKTPQSHLQKVLLGQGALRTIATPVDGSADGRWKAPQSVSRPWDPKQVEANKRLYPHLFTER